MKPLDLPLPREFFVEKLRQLGLRLRDAVLTYRQGRSLDALAQVAELYGEGDTIYQVDKAVDSVLVEFVKTEIATECPCILVAEGISGGEGLRLGGDAASSKPAVRLLVDPIDGTRGLMYDKRSAWVLTGIAPDRGTGTTLRDIQVAVQTEIPTTRQWRSDQLWASRGQGVSGQWQSILEGQVASGLLSIRPSTASHLRHGFTSFSRFFPGARNLIADLEEEFIRRIGGLLEPGQAIVFEDQYISTGGQLYELVIGHDRMVADVRPLVQPWLRERNLPPALTSHPYDLAAMLIAEEAGVVVVDAAGHDLEYPFDTTTECTWIGYANRSLYETLSPILYEVLRDRGLLD